MLLYRMRGTEMGMCLGIYRLGLSLGASGFSVPCGYRVDGFVLKSYEADRLIMIGSGSFSEVYLGSWSGRRVAIKVLSSYTPASLFRKEVEIWRKLRHDNVLRMWGASSAQGERPWFIVSEYCGGGSLVGWLRQRMGRVDESDAGGSLGPSSAGTKGEVDLLRCMHHISRGMLYLHDENVLHGDLKVSVDVAATSSSLKLCLGMCRPRMC